MAKTFDDSYPNISWWADDGGWIELGRDDFSPSMIRVLDIGGMLWEGKTSYETVAQALDEAEAFIARWRVENGY